MLFLEDCELIINVCRIKREANIVYKLNLPCFADQVRNGVALELFTIISMSKFHKIFELAENFYANYVTEITNIRYAEKGYIVTSTTVRFTSKSNMKDFLEKIQLEEKCSVRYK